VWNRIRSWYTRSRGLTKLALLLIGGLYAASFFMPAIQVLSTPLYGFEAFWLVIRIPVVMVLEPEDPDRGLFGLILLWFVNPIVWLGFVAIIKEKGALVTVAGLTALILGLSICFNTSEMRFGFQGLLYGYYAWLLSMLTMAFFGVWLMLADRRYSGEPGAGGIA
jgi:hypothetical protein